MLRRDFLIASMLASVANIVGAAPYYQGKRYLNGLGFARSSTAQTDLTGYGVEASTVYYPNDIWQGSPVYDDSLALPSAAEWNTAAALCDTDVVLFDIEHYTTASKLIDFYDTARDYFPGKSILGYQCGLNGFAGMVRTTSPYGDPSAPYNLFKADNDFSAQLEPYVDFVSPAFYHSKPNVTADDCETFALALKDEFSRLGLTKPIVPWIWRQHIDSASVGDNSRSISAISKANPCVVTISSAFSGDESLETGDWAICDDVGGMTELQNVFARVVKVDSTNYQLVGVDSSSFTAFTSGGTIQRLPTDAVWEATIRACIEHLDGFIIWNNAREWPSSGSFPFTQMPGCWEIFNSVARPAPYDFTLKPKRRR